MAITHYASWHLQLRTGGFWSTHLLTTSAYDIYSKYITVIDINSKCYLCLDMVQL